ncbi:hypothetical protein FPFC_014120 [Fructobacillus pseudoficulneus]|uniref:HTH cro/C1-type domain-containing protein n=1 Tax=Fructobacillus pseudoficulneus TaxID=220714 RepID=A0A3F3H6P5_9LACO|nr:helix-turn-helix domain-containing protein [Fructobacillus pseudoficulneus]GAP02529.1 hypothetical protein FPFC_014120 [Fructobacillus pseudoficulneus]SEH37424.1 Helix-turn-helix [Fructobacillus pseudoficulneus]
MKQHLYYLTPDTQKAIRRKRGELSLTKENLAKQLGVSRPTLNRIEGQADGVAVRIDIYKRVSNWLAEHV